MSFNELQAILSSDESKELGKEITECTLGALGADPIACKNLVQLIVTLPLSLREQYFWNKFYSFLRGIYLPFDQTISISNRLFGNDDKKRKNALRVVEAIGKIETEESLQFIINATRSCLIGLIDVADYFRIVKAITDTLYEDLIFLSQNITNDKYFRGNVQILALERSGLMIMAGIDANESVETQNYVFTTLGKMVDRYAISFENDERMLWHKENSKTNELFDNGITEITTEEIDELFDK